MDKKLKIILILTLISILSLIFLASKIEPLKVNINEINNNALNKQVKISATILSIREFPEKSFQIFLLKDATGNITAISNSNKHLELNKSRNYIFTGRIQEYNKTLQININTIELS